MLSITAGMAFTEAASNWLGKAIVWPCGTAGRFKARALVAVIPLIALIAAPAPSAVAQNQLWITQFGTRRHEFAYALASDGAGGVMVAGWTDGSLGGPNAGAADVILARYDSAGNRLWLHQFGTRTWEQAWALGPDGVGGMIVGGYTHGSLGEPNAGGQDAFVARYDNVGNRLWLRQFGTSEWDQITALAPDGTGGAVVAGNTSGSLGGLSAGGRDVFVARYSSEGDQLWIRQFGTSEFDEARALSPDGAGGVMVAGRTEGSLSGSNGGGQDVLIARFDSAGNQLWIRQFGTTEDDYARALTPDGMGGAIVAGSTYGSLGGPNAGVNDAFIARYDSAGNQLWIRQFGTSLRDSALALAPDGAGGIMVGGVLLGIGHGSRYQAFLAHYDVTGNQLWIRQFGTPTRSDVVRALALDGAGGIMVAGYTESSLGGPNFGGYDAFLARYEIDSCYADCDQSTGVGVLDMLDFLCFQHNFMVGNSYACDCDTSTGQLVCDLFDFLCFQNAFVGGCP